MNKTLSCFVLVLILSLLFVGCTTPNSTISDISQTNSTNEKNSTTPNPNDDPQPPTNKVPATPVPTPSPTPVLYIPAVKTPANLPVAANINAFVTTELTIDYSNSSKGYIMVMYTGASTGKIKFQITGADGRTYTYNIHNKTDFQVIPLTAGSGDYTLNTFEQAQGTEYYLLDSRSINAQLENEFVTYLHPNQFVDYNENSILVDKAYTLAQNNQTKLAYVEKVYNYVIETLTYDETLASSVSYDYLPDLDLDIQNKTGICFDYASLMTAMLRVQDIPTKLVVGWSGDIYHAWINVYIEETGWINGLIEFNGFEWKLMDPTFADNANQQDWIMQYIGDGNNYKEVYVY